MARLSSRELALERRKALTTAGKKKHPLLYQQVRIAFVRPTMPVRRALTQIQLRRPLHTLQLPSL